MISLSELIARSICISRRRVGLVLVLVIFSGSNCLRVEADDFSEVNLTDAFFAPACFGLDLVALVGICFFGVECLTGMRLLFFESFNSLDMATVVVDFFAVAHTV